jgi:hypothetical protein
MALGFLGFNGLSGGLLFFLPIPPLLGDGVEVLHVTKLSRVRNVGRP